MLLNPIDLSLKINEIFHQDEYEYFILLNYYARMIFMVIKFVRKEFESNKRYLSLRKQRFFLEGF